MSLSTRAAALRPHVALDEYWRVTRPRRTGGGVLPRRHRVPSTRPSRTSTKGAALMKKSALDPATLTPRNALG